MPKIAWLEALRIAATCAVIGIHILADMVGASYLIGSKRWWLANVVASGLRWSVPVFIIVSGYVLLGRSQTPSTFYQKRLHRLALPLIFWTVFYLVWTQILSAYYAEPLPIKTLLNLVVQGVPYYHLWYLYMLLGLYLITPVLTMLLERLSPTQITWLCVSALLAAVLCSRWFSLASTPFVFWFLPFLGYYLFGYWLHREATGVASRGLLVTLGLTVFITAVGSYLEGRQLGTNFGAYLYGYLSPNVMIMALAVILLFKQTATFWRKQFEKYPALQQLSDSSLLVYLLHPFLLDVLRLALPVARFHPVLSVLVIPTLFIVASWWLGLLVRRVPFVRYLG